MYICRIHICCAEDDSQMDEGTCDQDQCWVYSHCDLDDVRDTMYL
jgi:hypothetical protein